MDLLSNILQQNINNHSMTSNSNKSSIQAFYVKGKFTKPYFGQCNKFQQSNKFQKYSSSRPANRFNQPRGPIISHNCGIFGHKSPDCRKKRQDRHGPSSTMHMNSITNDDPLYLFSTNLDSSHQAMSWYLDSRAS